MRHHRQRHSSHPTTRHSRLRERKSDHISSASVAANPHPIVSYPRYCWFPPFAEQLAHQPDSERRRVQAEECAASKCEVELHVRLHPSFFMDSVLILSEQEKQRTLRLEKSTIKVRLLIPLSSVENTLPCTICDSEKRSGCSIRRGEVNGFVATKQVGLEGFAVVSNHPRFGVNEMEIVVVGGDLEMR